MVSPNNRIVMMCMGAPSKLFRQAVEKYGWPSGVKSDKGGENVDVAHVANLSEAAKRFSSSLTV